MQCHQIKYGKFVLFIQMYTTMHWDNNQGKMGDHRQGRRHKFEGGGSMHWKVGGQYSENTNIEKGRGCMTPPNFYGGAAPDHR